MKHTIKLKKYLDIIEEYIAADTIKPGYLLALDADGKVEPHGVAGGIALAMFALEDELRGLSIDDSIAAANPVQCWVAQRGEQVYARLDDGEDATCGDFMVSAGDGTLKVYDEASDEAGWIVAQALEDVDLTGSALPAGDFIKVVII